jgi:hypothetical protein
MSDFRDTLPDDATRARYDAAMDGLGVVFAAARRRRDERYAAGGALAVAEAAWVPGGPDVAELAAGYEQLAQEARQRQKAA